ncbi:hypothetical protein C8R47DRAFT_1063730 [Mycena vitilis]|nr:hypothetical protein C8R47DRAFT_1063730 [Mycena vitilis]
MRQSGSRQGTNVGTLVLFASSAGVIEEIKELVVVSFALLFREMVGILRDQQSGTFKLSIVMVKCSKVWRRELISWRNKFRKVVGTESRGRFHSTGPLRGSLWHRRWGQLVPEVGAIELIWQRVRHTIPAWRVSWVDFGLGLQSEFGGIHTPQKKKKGGQEVVEVVTLQTQLGRATRRSSQQ